MLQAMQAMQAASVWLIDSRNLNAATVAAFEEWLGASERVRLAAFVRSERRRQFVLGRALLRCALAPLLGAAPTSIPLIERRGQAPLLDWPVSELPHFSVSHSGAWIACAVSSGTALGLDIERRDATRDIHGLAAQTFDADQQAMLARLPPAQRVEAFYRLWSTAEARHKLGAPVAYEAVLAHPALSIVLCSAQPLKPVLMDGATLLSSAHTTLQGHGTNGLA